MKTEEKLIIEFHVEPADRSVGIMSEGFWAAKDDDCCILNDISPPKFTWESANTGEVIPRPNYAVLVEQALVAYANAWYEYSSPPDSQPSNDNHEPKAQQHVCAGCGIDVDSGDFRACSKCGSYGVKTKGA
jgi:hypothetical protein